MTFLYRFRVLGLLCLAACLACSSEAGPSGSASIALVVKSPDQLVDAVNFEMLCGTGEIIADQFALLADAAIPTWGTELNLPAGDCETIITALDAQENPICGGALRFPVADGQTTRPFVQLDCSELDADPNAVPNDGASAGAADGEASANSDSASSDGGGATAQAGLGAAVLDTDLADLDGVTDPDLVDFDDVQLNLCAVVVVGFRDLAGVGVGVFIDNSVGDQEITVVTDEICLSESDTNGDQSGTTGSVSGTGGEVSCEALDCDDGNDCTTDSCSDGLCANEPVAAGTECDGGTGVCLGAICIPGL